jgi:hypothetical protein
MSDKCNMCTNSKGCINCVDVELFECNEAADIYVGHPEEIGEDPSCYLRRQAFKDGYNYALLNAWKDAQGEDLPDIDKEVVALVTHYDDYKVVFAHRPDPEGWNGRNIDTGEITHYQPKLYDKGGWNMPDVKWWLDLELPK